MHDGKKVSKSEWSIKTEVIYNLFMGIKKWKIKWDIGISFWKCYVNRNEEG